MHLQKHQSFIVRCGKYLFSPWIDGAHLPHCAKGCTECVLWGFTQSKENALSQMVPSGVCSTRLAWGRFSLKFHLHVPLLRPIQPNNSFISVSPAEIFCWLSQGRASHWAGLGQICFVFFLFLRMYWCPVCCCMGCFSLSVVKFHPEKNNNNL